MDFRVVMAIFLEIPVFFYSPCIFQQFTPGSHHVRRFISGKVLQAGDNNHFHPTCARCTKCGDPFGDGEEMYLQVRPESVVMCTNVSVFSRLCSPQTKPPIFVLFQLQIT